MPKIKRPVMYNTTHKYNLTLVEEKHNSLRVKITNDNFDSLLNEFSKASDTIASKLEHSDEIYEVTNSDISDSKLSKLLKVMCPKVAHVYYYTKKTVPESILDLFNQYTNGTIVYLWTPRGNNEEIIKDAPRAFECTEVDIKLDLTLPDVNIWHLLFELYQVHAKVDQVILSFPVIEGKGKLKASVTKHYTYNKDTNSYHMNTKDKFRCFKVLQHAISVWGMGTQLEVNNEAEKSMIDYYRDCDQGRILIDRHKVTLKEVLDIRLDI